MNATKSNPSFARGGSTVVLGQVLYISVTLLSAVVLSRLLAPRDFGLVAMVGVLLALGEQIRDLGITTSALRAPKLTHAQASNLFWVSFALSAAVALLMALFSPLVADIYNEPRLAHITPVLAATILLNGMQSQFQVQLARQSQYVALAYVNVVANIAGVGVAVMGALIGWGYWSLVAQSVTFSLVGLILRVYAARWRPQLLRRRAGTKGLLGDGVVYSASSLVNFTARHADVFILGVRWDASGVGLYSRANQFVSLVSSLVASLTNVAVPVLNADRERDQDMTQSTLRIQTMVGLPVAVVFTSMAVSAETFIPLALGSGWEGAIPFLRVLTLGGLCYGLFYVNHWIFLVLLSSRTLLAYSLTGQLVAIVLIALGSFHSPLGTALGVVAGQVAIWLLGFFWLSSCIELRASALLLNGLRIVFTAISTFGMSSLLLDAIPHGAGVVAMVVELACVLSAFLVALTILPRGRLELRTGLKVLKQAFEASRSR